MKGGRRLIFTGDGKGKTTAALGMALRASGHGMKVKIVQFVKGDASTGEIAAIASLPAVEIVQTGLGFVPPETSPAFGEHKRAAEAGLKAAEEALVSDQCDLVILDEVCVAISLHLLSEDKVIEAVGSAGEGTTVVMTGRGATPGLVEIADTVTEMKNVKHGFREGWKAQEGVEF